MNSNWFCAVAIAASNELFASVGPMTTGLWSRWIRHSHSKEDLKRTSTRPRVLGCLGSTPSCRNTHLLFCSFIADFGDPPVAPSYGAMLRPA